MHTKPVIKGKYVKGPVTKAAGSRLSSHVKYLENRPFGEEETRADRAIFSDEDDRVTRRQVVDDVMQHAHPSVQYHKIIMSPAAYEHVEDYRQWTRDVMRDLQERQGIDLHWYAVIHAHEREQNNTPHMHVILAGTGADRQTGEARTVKMYTPDYQAMRDSAREHGNYDFYQQLERTFADLGQDEEREQMQQPQKEATPAYDLER
jgi:hypothetical protein